MLVPVDMPTVWPANGSLTTHHSPLYPHSHFIEHSWGLPNATVVEVHGSHDTLGSVNTATAPAKSSCRRVPSRPALFPLDPRPHGRAERACVQSRRVPARCPVPCGGAHRRPRAPCVPARAAAARPGGHTRPAVASSWCPREQRRRAPAATRARRLRPPGARPPCGGAPRRPPALGVPNSSAGLQGVDGRAVGGSSGYLDGEGGVGGGHVDEDASWLPCG